MGAALDRAQVLVVGAGPAGASAAIEAVRLGLQVTLVDEHPIGLATMAMDTPYLFGSRLSPTLADRGLMMQRVIASSEWLAAAEEAGVTVLPGTFTWGSFRPGDSSRRLDGPCVGLADGDRSWMLGYDALVLAAGARDLVLSFPGFHLPGVVGACGALALMTRYQALAARRMVILGGGRLALEVARLGIAQGVEVAGLVDVTPARFGSDERWAPLAEREVSIFLSHTVGEVLGDRDVNAIRLVQVDAAQKPVAGTERLIPCDTVCLAFGLVPSVELAYLTGCRLGYEARWGGFVPERDDAMETTVPGVYVVGDAAGVTPATVSDPAVAVAQGRRAAIAVAESRGALDAGEARRQAAGLASAIEPPAPGAPDSDPTAWSRALVASGGMDVTVCHCEEVTRRELLDVRPPRYLAGSPSRAWTPKLSTMAESGAAHPDLLKRLTRAGMGHCQGRRCREAVAFLVAEASGVDVGEVPLASYRPPVRPVALRVLSPDDEPEATRQRWASWFNHWMKVHA